ncbi:MAG: lipopolysaccharide transport periplasmic protein LptA [Aestuariibacter sp.]
MKHLQISAVTMTLLLSFNVHAGKDDFKLPIKVDSKTQFVDGKRKTSIFREDVHISQGTLKIDADEVEVIAEEGKGKEIFIARGKPAVYSQTMDDGSAITAKANEIRYQVETRMLDLNGAAELYQDASMVKGEKISFNLEKEQLIAGTKGGESRVTTVFQAEDDDDQQPQQ